MAKSIIAVVAGFVGWTILWLGSNTLLSSLFPSTFNADGTTSSAAMLGVILLSSIVFSVLSGALAGRIAKSNPVGSALALGVLLLAVGIFVQSQYWDLMPLWYHVCFLVALLPAAVYGGRMVARPRYAR